MKFLKLYRFFIATLLLVFIVSGNLADSITYQQQNDNSKQIFKLSNDRIIFSVCLEGGKLTSEILELQPQWSSQYGTKHLTLETDADFCLEVMWTGWRAPGKVNNADNPISLTAKYFRLERQEIREPIGDVKELCLFFKGIDIPFDLRLTYQLEPGAFYIRRNLALRDSSFGLHFLHKIWTYHSIVFGNATVIKEGGFGQPIALQYNDGGAFFGLEYPTSENMPYLKDKGNIQILCGQEIGERVGKKWIESEWGVAALTPNKHLKYWFLKYVDKIRVAALKPYVLYNSWYDLRSPDITEDPVTVMNEENVMRIIKKFRRNMFKKHGLNLDAFVLDDGWDVYRSDWVLREKQFPRGLKPIADELKKTDTALGMWFGPIGGYSKRDWRVEWMEAHGYEVVGDQLCLAGENYRKLFKKRVVDFVENYGVSYYKWDGIQFSCSEPDHGHATGIYSRRAVMESVIDLCRSVREKNPEIFLNITSGTWLSPWWVKYANTIWMQGGDYGYSDVPSISRRDRAITYRDMVLFEDYGKNDFWFPIANLMTHGIIKGYLQKLGGEEEPLDKFTDNAMLYFARGISMYELYISPDILTEGEWKAIAKSILWAKDRFPVLSNTEMIGGDPKNRETYGYAHFKGNQGIVAARNPYIEPNKLKVNLSPSLGLNPDANSLVIERIYPTRWIDPKLYSAGTSIEIPLDGYETAIYEIYPLHEVEVPLLAGVIFDSVKANGSVYAMKIYNGTGDTRILNPEKVKSLTYAGKKIAAADLSISAEALSELVSDYSVKSTTREGHSEIDVKFTLQESSPEATLAFLLEPDGSSSGKDLPKVIVFLDGKEEKTKLEEQKGLWAWYTVDVTAGQHFSKIQVEPVEGKEGWTGRAFVWLICQQKQKGTEISFELKTKAFECPMPPLPWPAGELRINVKLGEIKVSTVSK